MSAPRRDVVEVREFMGPRGGITFVMKLACGHIIWQRRKQPAKESRCVMCWWDANDDHPPQG